MQLLSLFTGRNNALLRPEEGVLHDENTCSQVTRISPSQTLASLLLSLQCRVTAPSPLSCTRLKTSRKHEDMAVFSQGVVCLESLIKSPVADSRYTEVKVVSLALERVAAPGDVPLVFAVGHG